MFYIILDVNFTEFLFGEKSLLMPCLNKIGWMNTIIYAGYME